MTTRYLLIAVFIMALVPTLLLSQEEEEEEENPHTAMVDDDFACLDCHTEVPKEGEKSPTYFLVDAPSENCLGCHDDSTHPGSKQHVGKDVKTGLPLDEESRIACFTCHDPHPAGVLKGREVYSAELGERSAEFLRLVTLPALRKEIGGEIELDPAKNVYLRKPMNKICSTCHETIKFREVYTPWYRYSEMFTY
ncbi:MAG TPA: hypothetical protein PKC29_00885 [Thermodesulfobacteriota bacterium]|nr:hypothetical protein [Thermodesulfobacteriota bacterium]